MKEYIYNLNLSPADRIIVPKSAANIIQHHGIYVGYDANGQHWFLENHHVGGVRYITAENFFKGISADKIRIQHFTGYQSQRSDAVNVAKSMVGRSYDLLRYNCEHYSNEVQYGKPESTQVTVGLAVVAGLFVCLFASMATSK